MIASPETIWQVPAYLPYLQSPLTQAVIASAEEKIGHKIPNDYLDLLKMQNGGYIRFSLPNMVHDSIAGIGPNFPSLTSFDWDQCQEVVSFSLKGLVPFDGDGHWQLCLDYRQHRSAPSVTYVDVECDREAPIAVSFADYLAKLRLEVGEDYVVEGEMDEVCAKLSVALGVAFEPPDSWAHGYPERRVGLGTEHTPEWAWLSPNSVPRGFVRPDDARYAILKDIMPGTVSRFPEIPANACILSATDAVRAKVVGVCVRSQIIVRPLRDYLRVK